MPTALAVDIGSSSVRAAIYDEAGREVAGSAARQEYRLTALPNGGVEADADELVRLVAGVIDETNSGDHPVACVGVSCFWHSVLGIDRNGVPVTPVLTWADTRASRAAAALRDQFDEVDVHARTGARLHASYLPAKLRYLRDEEPLAFERATRWMSFAEYLFLVLFGSPACGTSMASGTGLYVRSTGTWDDDLLAAGSVNAGQLTPISDEPAFGLRAEWASRWSRLTGIPWYPAFGDGACANIGSGCATPDRIALTIGTSSAMRVAGARAGTQISPSLWSYQVDGSRSLVGGALNEGGGMLSWLCSLMNPPIRDLLESRSSLCGPDEHGLTILPFAGGERSPGWADDASMSIAGISMSTGPVAIVRAALESVAYRLKLIADELSAYASPTAELIGSGGALLANPPWVQIIADVIGRPVRLSAEREAACRGAALLALERLGAVPDVRLVPAATGAVFEPDGTRHEIYQAASLRQTVLYSSLILGDSVIGLRHTSLEN